MPAKRPREKGSAHNLDPYVIVDFVFDRGLLFISIKNIGEQPAFAVRVDFGTRILGVEGTVEVSALPLFRKLEFLPGGKEITTFLDTSASYFRSRQPTKISTRISFRNVEKQIQRVTIDHDLEIYRDIGYVNREPETPDLVRGEKTRSMRSQKGRRAD
jgi:hypothetical protein